MQILEINEMTHPYLHSSIPTNLQVSTLAAITINIPIRGGISIGKYFFRE